MKKRSVFFALMIPLVMSGCRRDETAPAKEINFTVFGMTLASGWEGFRLQGIDSFVGGLTNKKDTLFFDYGWYSGDFKMFSEKDYIKVIKKINGKNAEVIRPVIKGEGILGVLIQADAMNRLRITGKSREEEVVLRMFDSIVFPDK